MKIPVLLYYPEDKGKKIFLKAGTHMPVWMVTYPRRWTVLVHCLIAPVGTDEKEAVPEKPCIRFVKVK